ncbi:hypothetical protein GCM10022215_04600 [Nocardioides fonticola]|uniref:Uncharacterized protein n=1 Tax=Nocardioides fonticola TaxID=450363 RepID=A0ABP7XAW0_9ACTN
MSPRYRLLAPEGWDRIPLDERAERAVNRIVERQFRGIDDAPHLRAELRGSLLDQVRQAAEVGGREMFLSSVMVGPMPLQSTLLVTELDGDPAVDDSEVLGELALLLREDAGVESARVAEHPAGRAQRRVRIEPAASAESHDTLVVEWYLVAPGGASIVLLTFSTFLLPIREAFETLFDVVASSVRWRSAVTVPASG